MDNTGRIILILFFIIYPTMLIMFVAGLKKEEMKMKKYVSFDNALKASAEGKRVASWLDDNGKPYNVHYKKSSQVGDVTIPKILLQGEELTRFGDLVWTVEEQKGEENS